MLKEGWPGGRKLTGGYCLCSLVKDLCQHDLVGRRMFLRLKPLLSRKNMRNVSSMGEPSLSEKAICAYLYISEILNIADTKDLHVEKYSSLGSQKLDVCSLLEYEWPARTVCEHMGQSKISEHRDLTQLKAHGGWVSSFIRTSQSASTTQALGHVRWHRRRDPEAEVA